MCQSSAAYSHYMLGIIQSLCVIELLSRKSDERNTQAIHKPPLGTPRFEPGALQFDSYNRKQHFKTQYGTVNHLK